MNLKVIFKTSNMSSIALSDVPQDYVNREFEIWLLTHAYFHRRDYLITETEILSETPQEILESFPTRKHILKICWDFVHSELLDNGHGGNFEIKATITDEGIFQFRKHLGPLYSKKDDGRFVDKILKSTTGDDSIRKQFKEFFKYNKNSSRDEFDSKLKDLMWGLGKEGIIFLAKLVFVALSGG